MVFLALLLIYFPVSAQENKAVKAKPEVFTDYYSARLLLDIYAHLTADTVLLSNPIARECLFSGASYPVRQVGSEPVSDPGFNGVHEGWSNSNLDIGWRPSHMSGVSSWTDIDNPHFPNRMRREIINSNREYRSKYRKQIPEEKQRLMVYLHALSAEEERPLVFTDIWRDYGGDIERYVDDIYDRSILINHKRMTNFCNYPRVKTFVSDPGVRFVISMELYRNAQKLKALQATVDSVK